MTAPDPTAGEPNIVQRIVNAWDCCGTCAGGVLARHMADREAAARAEALRDALAEWEGGPTGQAPIPRWWLEDRAAREAR